MARSKKRNAFASLATPLQPKLAVSTPLFSVHHTSPRNTDEQAARRCSQRPEPGSVSLLAVDVVKGLKADFEKITGEGFDAWGKESSRASCRLANAMTRSSCSVSRNWRRRRQAKLRHRGRRPVLPRSGPGRSQSNTHNTTTQKHTPYRQKLVSAHVTTEFPVRL